MLLDHGHQNAMRYPVGMVFVEAGIVAKRIGVQLAAQISLMQMALSSVPNMNVERAGTKRAAKDLGDLLKEMMNGE